MLHVITAQPLSVHGFAPFGQVISAGLHEGVGANQGTAVKFNRVAQFTNTRKQAYTNLAVFRSEPAGLPFNLRLLERHPFSTQAFLPLHCRRYLVCVAPDDAQGEPDYPRLRAFVCQAGQGINYRAGVWHHPIVALDGPAEFAMLAFEDGSPADCEERPLPFPILVRESELAEELRYPAVYRRVNAQYPIPPQEWERALRAVKETRIRKNGYFLRPGDDASRIGLVVKGLFQVSRLTTGGTESVKAFGAEGEFIAAYAEMLQGMKSLTYIQALENSTVLALSREDVDRLELLHPCWSGLTRSYLRQQFLYKEQREQEFLDCTAKERWERFQEQYPHLLARVAQRQIAAYLGITPVSFSRLLAQGRKHPRKS